MTISLTVAAQNLRAKIRGTPIILELGELNTATAAAQASAAAALASQTAAGLSEAAADADAASASADAASAAASAAAASATLANKIDKDGSVTFTANQPMGGFKLTGLAAATVDGDALRFEQLGAASATDNAAVRFDGTGGKSMQDSALVIADTTAALSRTGAGGISVQGTNTNDSAAAGNIGEYISASVAAGSAIALTTATSANITSISLTAGDWDVSIAARFQGNSSTTVTRLQVSISTTTATLDSTTPGQLCDLFYNAHTIFATASPTGMVGPIRLSLASTTTIFFVVRGDFAVSTAAGFGIISARRAR